MENLETESELEALLSEVAECKGWLKEEEGRINTLTPEDDDALRRALAAASKDAKEKGERIKELEALLAAEKEQREPRVYAEHARLQAPELQPHPPKNSLSLLPQKIISTETTMIENKSLVVASDASEDEEPHTPEGEEVEKPQHIQVVTAKKGPSTGTFPKARPKGQS